MTITLLPASEKDKDLLYIWVNDPLVRANSFTQNKILLNEHEQWLARKLASDDSKIFIAYKGDLPVGQVRVDFVDGFGLIDYSVDNMYRGKGFGTQILKAICEQNALLKLSKLVGRVKPDNIASCTAFYNAGFIPQEKQGYIEYIWEDTIS